MIYIRSNSNPEALYIWGGKDKVVNISYREQPPFRMPTSVLNGLIRKFNRRYGDGFNLMLGEELTYRKASLFLVKCEEGFEVCLSYRGIVDGKAVEWKCFMWEVTWMYIALTNKER